MSVSETGMARRDSEEEGGCISRRMQPLDLGGHRLADAHGGWRCSICKVFSSAWNQLARCRCAGSAASMWADMARGDALAGQERGRGHTRWLSDATIWCSRCCQYATQAAVELARACQPMRTGTASNRNALLRGAHPWTGVPLVASDGSHYPWPPLLPGRRVLRRFPASAAALRQRPIATQWPRSFRTDKGRTREADLVLVARRLQ